MIIVLWLISGGWTGSHHCTTEDRGGEGGDREVEGREEEGRVSLINPLLALENGLFISSNRAAFGSFSD